MVVVNVIVIVRVRSSLLLVESPLNFYQFGHLSIRANFLSLLAPAFASLFFSCPFFCGSLFFHHFSFYFNETNWHSLRISNQMVKMKCTQCTLFTAHGRAYETFRFFIIGPTPFTMEINYIWSSRTWAERMVRFFHLNLVSIYYSVVVAVVCFYTFQSFYW